MTDLPPNCQCTRPGHCQLLRRVDDPPEGRPMCAVRLAECQGKPHYYEMFLGESIAGGCTTGRRRDRATRRGLGDWIADLLSAVGIKKREGCGGCQRRQQRLNRLGWAIMRLLCVCNWFPRK